MVKYYFPYNQSLFLLVICKHRWYKSEETSADIIHRDFSTFHFNSLHIECSPSLVFWGYTNQGNCDCVRTGVWKNVTYGDWCIIGPWLAAIVYGVYVLVYLCDVCHVPKGLFWVEQNMNKHILPVLTITGMIVQMYVLYLYGTSMFPSTGQQEATSG